jgi:hypothetical protein
MAKGPGEEPRVFVIDDDASVRQALTSLLQSVALNVEAFGSPADSLRRGGRPMILRQPASFLTFGCPLLEQDDLWWACKLLKI